jgi:protocatechuate 3,4-dioxygenase beta subunit
MSLKSTYLLPILLVLLLGGGAFLALSDGDVVGPAEKDVDLSFLEGPDPLTLDAESKQPVLFGRAADPRPDTGAVLTARVMDAATGKPVANAKVLVAGANGTPRRHDTDGDGRFRVAGLAAPAAYILRVEAAGQPARVLSRVSLAAGAEADLGVIWLGAAGGVVGIVVDDTGRPVRGARVRAYPVGGGSILTRQNFAELVGALDREPVALGETHSKGDGSFALTGVPPGTVTVTADASGWQGARVQTGVASDGAGARVQLRLRAGHRLSGIVVDENGQPLSRVRVAAVPTNAGTEGFLYGRQFAWTDARGRFAFDGLPGSDESAILATARGCAILATARGRPTVFTEIDPKTQDDVRIVLPQAATLIVRLHAPGTGEPLAGVRIVMITGRTNDLQQQSPLGFLSGVTGADGSVTLDALPGHIKMAMFAHETYGNSTWGGQVAGMKAPGMMDGPKVSTIAPGRSTLDFTFPAGILVTGRVTTEAGDALGGAQVYVTRADSPESRPVSASADGGYSVRMHADAQLRVRAAGFWQPRASSTPGLVFGQEGPHEHDIVMQPAQIVTGRVLLPDGSPAAGALIRLPAAKGAAVGALRTQDAFARADGAFLLEDVAPAKGRRVLVRLPGFADASSAPFDVSATKGSRLPDIHLQKPAEVVVRVLDSEGAPVAGAHVSAWAVDESKARWDDQIDSAATRTTGADGRARIRQRDLETYRLQVEHAAYMPHAESVDLSDHAGRTAEIEIRLSTGRTVRGQVVDPAGRGLAGVAMWWMSQGGEQGEERVNRRVETAADGTYSVSGLPDQPMLVSVDLDGYDGRRVDVDAEAEQVDFTLTAVDLAIEARRTALVVRMKELVAQGDPGSDAKRAAVQAEFTKLVAELEALKALKKKR